MVAEVYKIKVADLRVNSREQGKNYELTRNAKRLARKVVKNGEFTRDFSFKETSLLVIKKKTTRKDAKICEFTRDLR